MEMNIWNVLLDFQFELNINTRTWLQKVLIPVLTPLDC